MPIYGFECPSCAHAFDRLQKLSDADPTVCPACSAEGIRRQVTAPAFRLAGSGWYETDFKKDGDRKRNLAGDGAGKSDSGPSDAAKADPGKPDTPKADAPKSDSAKAEPAKSASAPAAAAGGSAAS